MLPLLAVKNPIKVAMGALALATVIVMALLLWRINYLSDKVADQKTAIKGYQTTISELKDDSELRDRLAMADANDSVANERSRADVIGVINATQDSYGCSDVVNATLDSLRRNANTP